MADKPIKIIEIKDKAWMGGISVYPYVPTGGLFSQATNFDPFIKAGLHTPSGDPTRYGDAQIGSNVRISSFITYSSTVLAGRLLYAFGSDGSTAKLFDIRTSDGTTTDVSSKLSVSGTSRGAIEFKGKAVYIYSTTVTSNSIPIPSSGGEVTILSGLNSTGNAFMKVAPDRNLYITNGNKIARITSVTGTSGNATAFLTFEDNMATRHLDDDGQHLIIVGDANTQDPGSGNFGSYNLGDSSSRYRCFVAFGNMKSQDLTRVWDFNDQRVFGVTVVEDEVIIIGVDNIYTCSVNSKPRVLVPLKGNASLPASTVAVEPYAVIKQENGVSIWASEKGLRGYGRIHPSLPKAFFTAYTIPDSANFTTIRALVATGNSTNNMWATTDNGRLYTFINTTTQTSTLTIAGIDFKQPYRFAFAKVILDDDLASGQSVDIEILTGNGDQTVVKNTKNQDPSFDFTTYGAVKSHIFYPYQTDGSTTSSDVFDDLSDIKIINVGANIRRFEIWGYPIRPDQDTYL